MSDKNTKKRDVITVDMTPVPEVSAALADLQSQTPDVPKSKIVRRLICNGLVQLGYLIGK